MKVTDGVLLPTVDIRPLKSFSVANLAQCEVGEFIAQLPDTIKNDDLPAMTRFVLSLFDLRRN
jgi:hypothetical protein